MSKQPTTFNNNQHDWFALWADAKLSGRPDSILFRVFKSYFVTKK